MPSAAFLIPAAALACLGSLVGIALSGEVREQAAPASGQEAAAGEEATLGAVSSSSRDHRARRLQTTKGRATPCNETQLLCRSRCFDFTPDLSPTACAARGLRYQCMDHYDQVSPSPLMAGDFWPNCSNSTSVYQPFPAVAQPSSPCPGWAELVADTSYSHRMSFVVNETALLWNVVGGALEAKMLHRGRVGWMSIGIGNASGAFDGMMGAHVVMGNNYQDGSGPDVSEYHVHSDSTAFRFWSTPLKSSALKAAALVVTDCFSSMQFKTRTIYGEPLNLTNGTRNRLVWALTRLDYPRRDGGGYAGYHIGADANYSGRSRFRGHSTVDFGVGFDEASRACCGAPRWALIFAASAAASLVGRPLL